MPRPANAERAQKGETVLKSYGLDRDPFDAIAALLCDVRHYCAQAGIGFDAQAMTSWELYQADWKF